MRSLLVNLRDDLVAKFSTIQDDPYWEKLIFFCNNYKLINKLLINLSGSIWWIRNNIRKVGNQPSTRKIIFMAIVIR